MIHETLRPMAAPIDEVQPHPRNVRQGDVGLIAASLNANGQYRPIVVQRSTRYILAGNHTWRAAKSLGWSEVAVQWLDVDDDVAMRVMLADNRANDAATYDDAELLALLTELIASDRGLEGSLYTGDDLDDLRALLEAPSLDDVIGDVGTHDGTDGFNATVKFSVTLDTYERWSALWDAQDGSDDERAARIIDLAAR